MLPSETELLERDIQNERRARAKARKERFADEPVRGGGVFLTFGSHAARRSVLDLRAPQDAILARLYFSSLSLLVVRVSQTAGLIVSAFAALEDRKAAGLAIGGVGLVKNPV